MFANDITNTPLVTPAANVYFENITGDYYAADASFLTTLRALIAPRIDDKDRVHVRFGRSNYSKEAMRTHSDEAILNAMLGHYHLSRNTGTIAVHNIHSDKESNQATFELVERSFTNEYKGFHRLEKVKAFYKKSFNVDCYINPEAKNVILFVENLNTKKMHYLQVSILAFLPWYFDADAGVSELEMELLHSLREETPDNYMKCIERIASGFDFRSGSIRRMLAGFESSFEKAEVENVRHQIRGIDREIRDLNSRIGELLGDRNNRCIRLLGLENKIADGGEDSEIMEYFLCNKKLYLENVDGPTLRFAVKDYLSYFDREMAERTINNRRSFVYRYTNCNGMTADDIKKLMTEIFVKDDPALKIKVCAAYQFNLNGSVSPCSDHDYSREFDDSMPNMHIDEYSCMGNYGREINNLLAERNYIGAIEQCIASCKSLNWGDSPVMGSFMEEIWGEGHRNVKCIELPDGQVVTPQGAIEWLNEQERNNDGKKEEEETKSE